MKAVTLSGIYQVKKIGSAYFAAFIFNDGEILFLSKSYRTESGATKRLFRHCSAANVNLTSK